MCPHVDEAGLLGPAPHGRRALRLVVAGREPVEGVLDHAEVRRPARLHADDAVIEGRLVDLCREAAFLEVDRLLPVGTAVRGSSCWGAAVGPLCAFAGTQSRALACYGLAISATSRSHKGSS